MVTFNSGVLDRTRLMSNILMIVLLAGNIFFSIQYTENIKQQQLTQESDTSTMRIQSARLLKSFIDIVLNTGNQAISYDDRIALENEVRQMKDSEILKKWNSFVGSSDAKVAQQNAVEFMKLLANKALLQ
jgi:hypothetical protein